MTDPIATRAAVKSVAIKRALKVVQKPMLFQDWGVRGLLDGSKTQTRRVITKFPWKFKSDAFMRTYAHHDAPHPVGSFIWVRETWRLTHDGDLAYRAGGPVPATPIEASTGWVSATDEWRPSIFMPSWASRILLEVTDVRVQRVQDIPEQDASAEGIKADYLPANEDHPDCMCYVSQPDDNRAYVNRRDAFAATWDAINARRGHGWDVNPWVFAYTFRRVKP